MPATLQRVAQLSINAGTCQLSEQLHAPLSYSTQHMTRVISATDTPALPTCTHCAQRLPRSSIKITTQHRLCHTRNEHNASGSWTSTQHSMARHIIGRQLQLAATMPEINPTTTLTAAASCPWCRQLKSPRCRHLKPPRCRHLKSPRCCHLKTSCCCHLKASCCWRCHHQWRVPSRRCRPAPLSKPASQACLCTETP